METAKNIIKIELNHYNHILPVSQVCSNTTVPCIPESVIKAEVHKEKD